METTLKRFYLEPGDRVRLQPANASMQPIYVAARLRRDSGQGAGGAPKVLRYLSTISGGYLRMSTISASEVQSGMQMPAPVNQGERITALDTLADSPCWASCS